MDRGFVSSSVRTALRGHRVLTAGESLLIAASAGIVTMSAAVAGGAPATDGQAMAVALAVAILAGFTWGAERLGDAGSVARALDRRFGLSGAWLTAFEAESRGSASALAQLLAREIAPAVSVNRFVGDAARSSALFLAVPFASAALWSLAIDAREASPGPFHANGDATRDATLTAGAIAGPVHGEALRSEAARLASIPGLPLALVEELRALAAEAGALRRAEFDPAREAEERELAARLELLRRSALSSGMTPGAREGTMEGPDARIEPSPGASMEKPTPPSSVSVSGSGVTSAGTHPAADPERAVFASRWWPARHDSIVERWVESGRTVRDGRPR